MNSSTFCLTVPEHSCSMIVSLLWQCLTVRPSLSFVKNPLICFLCCRWNLQNLWVLSSQRCQDLFLHSVWESRFHSRMLLQGEYSPYRPHRRQLGLLQTLVVGHCDVRRPTYQQYIQRSELLDLGFGTVFRPLCAQSTSLLNVFKQALKTFLFVRDRRTSVTLFKAHRI